MIAEMTRVELVCLSAVRAKVIESLQSKGLLHLDEAPLAVDEAAARAAGFTGLVAPPTFAVTLGWSERFRHSLDLGTRAVLHGEQSFEFTRPIVSGDRLGVKSRVVDVQERTGASGPVDVLVVEDEGRDDKGALVYRARATLIIRRG